MSETPTASDQESARAKSRDGALTDLQSVFSVAFQDASSALSKPQELQEAAWKAYDTWIRFVNELTDLLYADSLFGETAARWMELALGWQRFGSALAGAFFATLWPSIGLPTATALAELRAEIGALREATATGVAPSEERPFKHEAPLEKEKCAEPETAPRPAAASRSAAHPDSRRQDIEAKTLLKGDNFVERAVSGNGAGKTGGIYDLAQAEDLSWKISMGLAFGDCRDFDLWLSNFWRAGEPNAQLEENNLVLIVKRSGTDDKRVEWWKVGDWIIGLVKYLGGHYLVTSPDLAGMPFIFDLDLEPLQ